MDIALHDFPGCTVIQDILVAKVEPYFSICLSRDFTTQIGGTLQKIGLICSLGQDMGQELP